jgi:hypothetical protein
MRRMNLKRIVSFITRQHTLDINTIRSLFIAEHEKCFELNPAWNLKATRKLIIATYWFKEVLIHFGVIIAVSVLFTLPQYNSWLALPASILFASLPALFTLTAFVYLPSFLWKFLPNLDVITGEQEKLAMQTDETAKCRRTQFQAPTLIIIYYVHSKISNTPLLPANDQSAGLLNKLYGSDKDKLKHNLSRLYKLPTLSVKERAEMLKGIDNARTFYNEAGYTNTSKILDDLEFKLNREATK